MTAPLPRLPKLLAIALKAGGLDAVLKLARAFGGKQMTLPTRCGDNHPLVVAVGRKVADAICGQAGGIGKFDFPRGTRSLQRLALDELLDRDPPATLNEIAEALGKSHRQAANLKRAREHGGTKPAAAPQRRIVDPRQIDMDGTWNRDE
jgi:hypothetical protein